MSGHLFNNTPGLVNVYQLVYIKTFWLLRLFGVQALRPKLNLIVVLQPGYYYEFPNGLDCGRFVIECSCGDSAIINRHEPDVPQFKTAFGIKDSNVASTSLPKV